MPDYEVTIERTITQRATTIINAPSRAKVREKAVLLAGAGEVSGFEPDSVDYHVHSITQPKGPQSSEDIQDEYCICPTDNLRYMIGSNHFFIAFDFIADDEQQAIAFASSLEKKDNSVQDFEPACIVPIDKAVEYAEGLARRALAWCKEKEVPLNEDGRDAATFVAEVRSEVSDMQSLLAKEA